MPGTLQRQMLKLMPHSVTTRHSASLYPLQAERSLPSLGPVIGVDHLSGGTKFCYDPWALYERKVITNPNMLVLGKIGTGKSAFVKSYLHRQSLFGRQIFIIDPKGEYTPLAEALGLAIIRLVPGGLGGRVNPLDPGPLGDMNAVDLRRRREEMLAAIAASGLKRELSSEERAALNAALRGAEGTLYTPTIAPIVETLLKPNALAASDLKTSKSALTAATRDLALELRRLVSGDLAGMFDGETTTQIDWSGPGVLVDISELHNTPALAPVMICTATWLSQAIAAPSDRKRILVLDEAWAALRFVAVTRWLQSTAKLARSHGVQLVVVAHRLSDFSAQGDSGSEAVRQAVGLISDVETRVLYGQGDSERALLREMLALPEAEVGLLCEMAPYRALWKVGRNTAVVEHMLSNREYHICNTDAAMTDGEVEP